MTMKVLALAVLGVLALPSCASAPEPAGAARASGGAEPVARDVDLYTHCGVESAHIDGRWWHVVEPLYGTRGPGAGPPAAWEDPVQRGRLTVQGDHAVFEAAGHRVVLTPAPADAPVRVCR